jgi:transcription antitermination factor NusG
MLKVSDNPPMLSDGFECPSAIDGDWWVAHTRARSEKALAWDLHDRDIPYFLPMAEKTMIWGGRKRKVLTPIFPSYVFFSGDQTARHRVFSTDRVCQTIAVKLRKQFIAELDTLHEALANHLQLDLYPFAAIGSRCRITKGPLQGIEGIVIRKDDVLRLVLQVSMLGQGASLEITADLLEPVD